MSTVSVGDLLVKYKADVSDLTSKVKSVKSELSSVSASAEKSGKSLKKQGEGAKEAGGGLKEMIKHGLQVSVLFTAVDMVKEGVSKLSEQVGDVIQFSDALPFL